MTREPRTTYQYSNMMFAVVGHVIEILTGMRLGDFLRERIWSPLGMYHTFLYYEEAIDFVKSHDSVQLATPYRWVPKGASQDGVGGTTGHFSAEEYQDLNATAGAGAVLSTVSICSSSKVINYGSKAYFSNRSMITPNISGACSTNLVHCRRRPTRS